MPWTDSNDPSDRELSPPTIEPTQPPPAVSWWSADWGCRVPIQVTQGEIPSDAPVLVRLDTSRIEYNNFAAGGEDVRFLATDSASELAYTVESWNPGGETRVWIRWPSAGTPYDDFVHLYCYNPAAAPKENPTGVWSDFVGVWHLDGDDLAAGILDESSAQNTGTVFGAMDATNVVPGFIDTALDFDGTDDGIDLGTDATLTDFTQGITITAWIHPDTIVNFPTIVDKDYQASFSFYINDTNRLTGELITSGGNVTANSNVAINTGEWTFVAMTYDNNDLRIYINGQQRGSATGGTPIVSQPTIPALIGAGWEVNVLDYFFDGMIDEVRIEPVARSAQWIDAQYHATEDTALTYDAVEFAP